VDIVIIGQHRAHGMQHRHESWGPDWKAAPNTFFEPKLIIINYQIVLQPVQNAILEHF